MSNIYLTIRTKTPLDVRYDAPPPGRLHEGAVSLTLADDVFAIFDSPDAVDDIAHKLLSQASRWRAALNGGRPDEDRGRHNAGRDTAPEPVTVVDTAQADEPEPEPKSERARYRPDPLEDTLVLYPDPAEIAAQATASMGGGR